MDAINALLLKNAQEGLANAKQALKSSHRIIVFWWCFTVFAALGAVVMSAVAGLTWFDPSYLIGAVIYATMAVFAQVRIRRNRQRAEEYYRWKVRWTAKVKELEP